MCRDGNDGDGGEQSARGPTGRDDDGERSARAPAARGPIACGARRFIARPPGKKGQQTSLRKNEYMLIKKFGGGGVKCVGCLRIGARAKGSARRLEKSQLCPPLRHQ